MAGFIGVSEVLSAFRLSHGLRERSHAVFLSVWHDNIRVSGRP